MWCALRSVITAVQCSALNSVQYFQPHKPPYASCIFFELHKENELPFVQVFYRNSTEIDVSPLEIPNCGTECPLSRFYELYRDILPTQSFDRECALHDDESLPANKYINEDL